MAYRAIGGNIRVFGNVVSLTFGHQGQKPVAIQTGTHFERLESLRFNLDGLGNVPMTNRAGRLDFFAEVRGDSSMAVRARM